MLLCSLLGMCEALWFEDMGPDELFESISQALVNAVDRDASAGWGGIVHIIEPHQVMIYCSKGCIHVVFRCVVLCISQRKSVDIKVWLSKKKKGF